MMKVWEARLTLGSTGREWMCFFEFESDGKDYVLNQHYYCESKGGWAVNKIPVEMEFENNFGTWSIVKGFDYELDSETLKALKEQMRQMLILKIEEDREKYLALCLQRLEALNQV